MTNRIPPKQDDKSCDPSQDVIVSALVKGSQRFIVLYREETLYAALRQVGRWAANPDIDFTWYDAARFCQVAQAAQSRGET